MAEIDKLRPGDRIQVTRKGALQGKFGTVLSVTVGFSGTVFISAALDNRPPGVPTYGTERDFRKAEISKTEIEL